MAVSSGSAVFTPPPIEGLFSPRGQLIIKPKGSDREFVFAEVVELSTSVELKAALFGGEADEASMLDVLLDSGPEAVAALVAVAAGKATADYEAVIARLPDDTLIPLVNATIQLTMPEGIEPFFAKLTGLMGVAEKTEAPAPGAKRIRKAA